jgi:hypothetical protein
MDAYTLSGEYYLYPTPGGVGYAVQSPNPEPARHFLQRLLSMPITPQLTEAMVQEWTGLPRQEALEFIYHLQSSGYLQGLLTPLAAPEESLEALLPPLLERLSDDGKAVLAEKRGLYLSSAGYSHEATEELAALGADLAAVHERHRELLNHNLRLRGGAWGLLNAAGIAELGFWPIYFGREYFVLAISGQPRFNQMAFTTLVWSLGVRYGVTRP